MLIPFEEGVYNYGVELKAEEQTEGEEFATVEAQTESNRFTLYDINTTLNGENVQPDGEVTVKLPIPRKYDKDSLSVYYVPQEGNIEKIASFVDGDYIYFDTTHFSCYAIVENQTAETPADSGNETQTDNACKYCGNVNTGFWGKIIAFFHKILTLFGLHK